MAPLLGGRMGTEVAAHAGMNLVLPVREREELVFAGPAVYAHEAGARTLTHADPLPACNALISAMDALPPPAGALRVRSLADSRYALLTKQRARCTPTGAHRQPHSVVFTVALPRVQIHVWLPHRNSLLTRAAPSLRAYGRRAGVPGVAAVDEWALVISAQRAGLLRAIRASPAERDFILTRRALAFKVDLHSAQVLADMAAQGVHVMRMGRRSGDTIIFDGPYHSVRSNTNCTKVRPH